MPKMLEIRIVRNLRKPDNDLEFLIGSIKDRGVIVPILVDHSYNVLDGVRRVEACKRLGIQEIPAEIVRG